MKLKLYSYWRSSCSWRVRTALLYKRLPFDLVPVNLVKGENGEHHSDAYAALNVMRQVPTLEIDDKGKLAQLGQSLAIIEYLEEIHPTPTLLPADRMSRAVCRQMAEIVNSGTQPLQNLSVIKYIKSKYQADDGEWCRHFIQRGLDALERLAALHAGRYLVGDQISVADVCLVPQLYNARRYELDTTPYPTLLRVESECMLHSAFQQSHPNNQPDAVR